MSTLVSRKTFLQSAIAAMFFFGGLALGRYAGYGS
jgi:hypothetical protein